ncbi:uracil-DNA glycosylase family protein [Spongiivirga sp. MCCC 1A20706]|uniref:uracil-DNA glycosylase family protein n=1 Tax=Spongiivirga sp. MCCC 1A20706 TaxID=3160963 RepID=UPI003977317A
MMTFANQILGFLKQLGFNKRLPKGIKILHPFHDETVMDLVQQFYQKYYNDTKQRKLVLGINPGRLGAGATGIPFTDPKRLRNVCNIHTDIQLHEPSSVFVYEVIEAFGGAEQFYNEIYISSVCPLGFVIEDEKGRVKNYNYYDSAKLTKTVQPFIVKSIKEQLEFGIERDQVFCMGTGKNYKFLNGLNKKEGFFKEVIPIEHPRYVMQYKMKQKERYIEKYISALRA